MQTNFSIDSKWLLCLALLLWQGIAFAQTPAIVWQKSFGGSGGEAANAIQQTTDGGYIVAGSSYSTDGDVTGNYGNGYADYWVVKLDAEGTLLWQKCLGGSGYDEATAIQQTTDEGYIVAGYSSSNDGEVTGNHGDADCWVVRLDANGTIVWQKSLGGSEGDGAAAIQQTTDGGYIVAGSSSSNDGNVIGNHGNSDYWIVKLDAMGAIAWQKCLGGFGSESANAIQQCTDGGYIVAGYSGSIDGDVTENQGGWDYWIVKLDAIGNLSWQKNLGGSDYEMAGAIQQCVDGGYIVAGSSISIDRDIMGNHGDYDYWIVKLDAAGNLIWQKCLGGSGYDVARTIQQCADGGYIVAGFSHSLDGDVSGNQGVSDYWIVKLAVDGTLLWQKSFGRSMVERAHSIQQCRDGGYIVAGWSNSIDGDLGNSDYWIVKLKDYAVGLSGISGLIVFPNPVVGNSLKVEYYLSAATEVEIRIIDVSGRCVWCAGAEPETVGVYNRELDVQELASGLYFLEISTKYGTEIVRWVKG